MNQKKLAKIIIPICVVLVVGGIWVFKGMENKSSTQSTLPSNPDFTLETDAMDLETLTSYGLPIVIDFGADWCPSCKEFTPILKAMHEEMLGLAIIKYVDVDKSSEITANFPIQVIPSQVFITADGSPYIPSETMATQFSIYTDNETNEPIFTVHQGGLTADELRTILADMEVTQ